MRKKIGIVALVSCFILLHNSSNAGVIFGTNGNLGGGFRWDADARTVSGNERSLDGGLRYSVQGGSMQSYRDLFSWNVLPTVAAFTQAVQQAFAAWEAPDPTTGLTTSLSFVDDTTNTAVIGTPGFGGLNFNGAEIDLFGADAGDAGTRGVAQFSAIFVNVTLTSGTENYGQADGGGAIRGADVYINSNAGAVYSLDLFRRLLTHELGHAIGLGDVEDFSGNGFIDDNYDGTNSTTAANSLTNSWASLVNPLNPEASVGLTQFAPGVVANADPGIDSVGVNILMESQGLGISGGNPLSNLVPLTNDDYGTRQFLYPSLSLSSAVPGPSSLVLACIGITISGGARHRSKRRKATLN